MMIKNSRGTRFKSLIIYLKVVMLARQAQRLNWKSDERKSVGDVKGTVIFLTLFNILKSMLHT